jgi:hypothetical protein
VVVFPLLVLFTIMGALSTFLLAYPTSSSLKVSHYVVPEDEGRLIRAEPVRRADWEHGNIPVEPISGTYQLSYNIIVASSTQGEHTCLQYMIDTTSVNS